ncbi:MAG: choice-of-anchor J domain-containing protein [Bacteroidales bacterium]|nr:choice-of-anchor J domain-containing protein [Bacteroidales bacterium]
MKRFTLLLTVMLLAGFLTAQQKDFSAPKTSANQELSFEKATVTKAYSFRAEQLIANAIAESQSKGSKGTYMFEGFEGVGFPPAGWTVYSPDGGSGWERQTAGASPIPGWTGGTVTSAPVGGGIGVAFCTWSTGGAASNDQWLVTSQYTSVQTGDLLTFWINKYFDYADKVDIKLSTTDNQMASFTTTIASIVLSSTDTGWVFYSYPLDAYAGSDIYIAFNENVADNQNDGDAIFLDNVAIGSPPADDVGAISVDISSMIQPGAMTPLATVMNFGSATQTFDVEMIITGGYTSVKTVTGLAAGGTVQVTFDLWDPPVGDYVVDVCTQLTGDVDPANDCASANVKVLNLPNTKVYCYVALDPTSFLPAGPAYFFLNDPSIILSIADQSADDPIYAATWGPGNKWYGIAGVQLVTLDTITGNRTVIGNANPSDPANESWTGISFDYSTNTLYGITYNGSAAVLYSINHTTGNATQIGISPGKLLINLACNLSGSLYAVDIGTDELCAVNKNTGVSSAIGNIGLNANYAQTMEFDRENDICYYLSYNDVLGGQLRLVDVVNGGTTVIGDLLGGAEITGLAVPYYGPVGIKENIADATEYNVYPNPARNYVYVTSNEKISNIRLINYVGQTILEIPVNDKNVRINTSSFGSGVYFLQMENEDGITTRKITIE